MSANPNTVDVIELDTQVRLLKTVVLLKFKDKRIIGIDKLVSDVKRFRERLEYDLPNHGETIEEY